MAATEPSSAGDPQAAAAAGSPDATGSSVPTEPATGSRTRARSDRSAATQEAQPAAPPDPESAPAPAPEPDPEPDAMVVALFLPDSETWCTGDGTPYRAHHGQPVHVRRRHVPELVARGAREPEREPEP